MPLTLLFFTAVGALFCLGGIIEDVINSDPLVFTDIQVASRLESLRTPGLTQFFIWITLLGKPQMMSFFITATLLILWIGKKRSYILPLLFCIAGSELVTTAIKLLLHRARPSAALYMETSFSFPSGHANIALAFYGFITYLLIRNVKSWEEKISVFFTGLLLAALIGFSRLYLGVHYFSDVLGGYLVGILFLIVTIVFTEYFVFKKRKRIPFL